MQLGVRQTLLARKDRILPIRRHGGISLETVAREINARIRLGDRDTKKGEEHYLAAGIQLIEAQARVRAEQPGTPWLTWTAVNFPTVKAKVRE
jgi:hypothetical protein